jgi:hypothetical protein
VLEIFDVGEVVGLDLSMKLAQNSLKLLRDGELGSALFLCEEAVSAVSPENA